MCKSDAGTCDQGVVNCSGKPKRSLCKRLTSILQNIQPEWFLLDIYVNDVRDIFIVIKKVLVTHVNFQTGMLNI